MTMADKELIDQELPFLRRLAEALINKNSGRFECSWTDDGQRLMRFCEAAARLRSLTADPDEAMVERVRSIISAAHPDQGFFDEDRKITREVVQTALSASPRREGWQMVPVEPTEAMEEAHFAAHAKAETVFADVKDIWAAMLAAAPAAPQEDGK